jgi:hypothetical protein
MRARFYNEVFDYISQWLLIKVIGYISNGLLSSVRSLTVAVQRKRGGIGGGTDEEAGWVRGGRGEGGTDWEDWTGFGAERGWRWNRTGSQDGFWGGVGDGTE